METLISERTNELKYKPANQISILQSLKKIRENLEESKHLQGLNFNIGRIKKRLKNVNF